jgi:ATP-dependent Clp protease protease subunit
MSKDEKEQQEVNEFIFIPPSTESGISKVTGLYGEVSEENCRTLVNALYYFRDITLTELETNEAKEEGEEKKEPEPIECLVSTEGGSVQDMFAVYDCVREIRKTCEIETFGVGKVMSAGVLLLASGTKGKRKVGANCRLMLHAPSGGQFGSIKELQVDIKEVKWYQNQLVKSLAQETDLTERKIRAIFRRKTDTYFDAKQAVEWGIADEIV